MNRLELRFEPRQCSSSPRLCLAPLSHAGGHSADRRAQPSLPTLRRAQVRLREELGPASSVPVAVKLGVLGSPSPAQPCCQVGCLDLQEWQARLAFRQEQIAEASGW